MPAVRSPVVQFQVSQFFSGRVRPAARPVRVRRFARENAGLCTRRDRAQAAHVPSGSAQGFRRQDQFVPAVVPARPHAGLASATFLAG